MTVDLDGPVPPKLYSSRPVWGRLEHSEQRGKSSEVLVSSTLGCPVSPLRLWPVLSLRPAVEEELGAAGDSGFLSTGPHSTVQQMP